MKRQKLMFGILFLLPISAASAQLHAHVIETVAKATPIIALLTPSVRIVNVGQTFTWEATVQGIPVGAPTGNVSITAKTPVVANAMSSGNLPLAPSTNPGVLHPNPWVMKATVAGMYTTQAIYPGDTNYNSATSDTQQVAVLPPADFSLDVPGTATIKQGQSLASVVTVHSINNFTGTVTLTCSGMAPGMNCSPKLRALAASLPASAYQQLAATPASASSSLAITTSATTVTTVAGGFLLFLFPGAIRRKPKRKLTSAFVLALLGSLIVLAGCGGFRYLQTNGTPRGTYRLSITGTSGPLTHTQYVTVTVD